MSVGNGLLKLWGSNGNGQLGDGTTTEEHLPVVAAPHQIFQALARGANRSYAIDENGIVYGWGENPFFAAAPVNYSTPQILSQSSTYTTISGTKEHVMVLDSLGMIWAWGDPDNGKLGDGGVSTGSPPVSIARYASYAQISAGVQHSLALDAYGRVWSWGSNVNGELGDGTTDNRSTPVAVIGSQSFVQIAAGDGFSLAIDDTGVVWAWGAGTNVGTGNGLSVSSPTSIAGSGLYTQIAAYGHALAIDTSGMVWAWGSNAQGQLGDGTTTDASSPVSVARIGSYTAISAGAQYSFAIDADGTVYGWGANSNGQIGDGTTDNVSSPVSVAFVGTCDTIQAANAHTIALKDSPVIEASLTRPAFIKVPAKAIRISGRFTCLGWIQQPIFTDAYPLVLLAVAGMDNIVLNSEKAVRFELLKEGADYRLQIAHSKSKLIKMATHVDITDKNWHMLSYVCYKDGSMKYYVDSVYLPPEDGTDPNGMPFSTAWSREPRKGGGDVWCPYLYRSGQSVSVFDWRFGMSFSLDQGWLNQIMSEDKKTLGI